MDSTPMDSMRMKIRSLLILGWALALALVFAFLAGKSFQEPPSPGPGFIRSPSPCADEVHPLSGVTRVSCSSPMHHGELRQQVGVSFLVCRCARSDASSLDQSPMSGGEIDGGASIASLASSM